MSEGQSHCAVAFIASLWNPQILALDRPWRINYKKMWVPFIFWDIFTVCLLVCLFLCPVLRNQKSRDHISRKRHCDLSCVWNKEKIGSRYRCLQVCKVIVCYFNWVHRNKLIKQLKKRKKKEKNLVRPIIVTPFHVPPIYTNNHLFVYFIYLFIFSFYLFYYLFFFYFPWSDPWSDPVQSDPIRSDLGFVNARCSSLVILFACWQ